MSYTRKQIVLRTTGEVVDREDASDRVYPCVTYDSTEVFADDSDRTPSDAIQLRLSEEDYNSFGRPTDITVTIEPADTMNGGN